MPTFRSDVNVVIVPVVVRNKHGQAIGGLTKDDFRIFDRGKLQAITSFSVIKRSNTDESPQPSNSQSAEANPAAAPISATAEATRPSLSTRPKRFLIYVFDDMGTDFADMAAVRSVAVAHLQNLSKTDRAALYTVSGRPQVEFTNDGDELAKAAAKLRSSSASVSSNDAKNCPNINYYLADLIENRSDQRANSAAVSHTTACAHVDAFTAAAIVNGTVQRQLAFAPQQIRMALRVLRLAVRQLAQMPGERVLILASPGFFAQTPEAITETEQILKMAAKANIMISAISSRGL